MMKFMEEEKSLGFHVAGCRDMVLDINPDKVRIARERFQKYLIDEEERKKKMQESNEKNVEISNRCRKAMKLPLYAKHFSMTVNPFPYIFADANDTCMKIFYQDFPIKEPNAQLDSSILHGFIEEHKNRDEKYYYIYLALLIVFSRETYLQEDFVSIADFAALLLVTPQDLEDVLMIVHHVLTPANPVQKIENPTIAAMFSCCCQ